MQMTEIQIEPNKVEDYVKFEAVPQPNSFQCKITPLPHQASNQVNHVNNIEIIKWFDKASELHCDHVGWTRKKMLEENIMWFVARHEIDYQAEATMNDRLVLATWVEDIRRVKSWRHSIIYSIEEECRVISTCRTLWVLVNLMTRKPVSVPEDMATALNPVNLRRSEK